MKKLLIMLMLVVGTAYAADYGVFVAKDKGGSTSNDVLVADYKLSNAPALTNACADEVDFTKEASDTQRTKKLYRVIVNKTQYEAGWTALAKNKKDAAKDAADIDRKDVDKKFDAETKAQIKVLLDYLAQIGGTNTWRSFKKDYKKEMDK